MQIRGLQPPATKAKNPGLYELLMKRRTQDREKEGQRIKEAHLALESEFLELRNGLVEERVRENSTIGLMIICF